MLCCALLQPPLSAVGPSNRRFERPPLFFCGSHCLSWQATTLAGPGNTTDPHEGRTFVPDQLQVAADVLCEAGRNTHTCTQHSRQPPRHRMLAGRKHNHCMTWCTHFIPRLAAVFHPMPSFDTRCRQTQHQTLANGAASATAACMITAWDRCCVPKLDLLIAPELPTRCRT